MEDFIRGVPKVELHVHLEGTLTPSRIFQLAARNNQNPPMPSISALSKAISGLSNLKQFLDLYYECMNVLRTEQDFYDMTADYLQQCVQQNIRHIEPFFDPQMHVARGVKLQHAVQGIHRALVDAEREYGITSKLIACIVRDCPVESAEAIFEEMFHLGYFESGILTGIGLDSDEIDHPPILFKDIFQKAEKMGIRRVGHGGHDGLPYPYIWQLLTELNVERIDHGVRCVEDRRLMELLREKRIPLTVCPISNVKIGPYASIEQHPIRIMLENELMASIHSDDPAYLSASLTDNYLQVANTLHWKIEDIKKVIVNSIESSFLNDQQKEKLQQELQSFCRRFE